jgi:Spy/CpxP family protein refolding chaperone
MKTLSLKPDPDEQAVISKQEQISKIQADMAMERIKLLLKIRHLLTADQKQRLVELMQKNAGAPASSN